MHILLLSHNFYPEGNAPASRSFEHSQEWIKNGHKVTVITCFPNFPEGKVYDSYKNNFFKIEKINGIDIWRVKTFITANKGTFRRILSFLSFMISSFIFGLFTKKVDVVIGTSPQFFTVISAYLLSKIKRVKFVFELRDLWPESIKAVKAIQNNLVISLLERIELFLYKNADLIITVTSSFKKTLITRGIKEDKIEVILNGVDSTKFNPVLKKNDILLEEYNLNNKFIIGYIGTLGMAHALENIIFCAKMLEDNKNIKFIFVGDGSEKENLKNLILRKNLKNITMIPMQSKNKMREIWGLCDISIVSLKNTPLFKTVIPSKIFESMAMGLPIVGAIPDGEAAQIIKLYNAGLIIEPENPNQLKDSIQKLYSNAELRKEFSINSYNAAQHFDRNNMAKKMITILERTYK